MLIYITIYTVAHPSNPADLTQRVTATQIYEQRGSISSTVLFVGESRLLGVMGNSGTSDVTKGSRALSCMFTAFLVTFARARTGEVKVSSGHARGLTCSQIVETAIYT